MLKQEIKVRVRYADTDQMGYLYYGNYAAYYEMGRAEWIRNLGYTYRQLEEEEKVMMPVMSLNCRFVRPGKYDDLLTITTEVRKVPDQFITFHHEVFNEANELLNGGSVKLAFVDAETRIACSAPVVLKNYVQQYIIK